MLLSEVALTEFDCVGEDEEDDVECSPNELDANVKLKALVRTAEKKMRAESKMNMVILKGKGGIRVL